MFIARDRSVFDDVSQRMLDEGLAALPDPYGGRSEQMLPNTPHRGRCRICGEDAQLTREHIPPGAAFNLSASRMHRIDEWIQRQGDEMPGGLLKQGGVWGYTLCKRCNDITGARYGLEYKKWADAILAMLAEAKTNVRDLDAELETRKGVFSLDARDGGPAPRPGAFVRQVLAMFCSISAGFDLAGRYPEIRRMILDGSAATMPDGMSLGMTVYLNTRSRVIGPMWYGDTARGTWQWAMEIAHAPIASLLILKSNRTGSGPAHLCDITKFTEVSGQARASVEANLEVTTGYQPEIADYRTRARVEADARETILVARPDESPKEVKS